MDTLDDEAGRALERAQELIRQMKDAATDEALYFELNDELHEVMASEAYRRGLAKPIG